MRSLTKTCFQNENLSFVNFHFHNILFHEIMTFMFYGVKTFLNLLFFLALTDELKKSSSANNSSFPQICISDLTQCTVLGILYRMTS